MKRCFMFILTAALCLTGCGRQAEEATARIFAMDTVMEVTAYGGQAEQVVTSVEETIRTLEDQFSRTKEDSAVSALNREGTAENVPEDVRQLIARAQEYRDATGGAFDITIAPVMDAWGFTGDSFRVPSAAELAELLTKVDSNRIRMQDGPSASVTLGEGQAIDLGGIAKGYTSDQVERVFRGKRQDLAGGQCVRAGRQARRLRLAGGHPGSPERERTGGDPSPAGCLCHYLRRL